MPRSHSFFKEIILRLIVFVFCALLLLDACNKGDKPEEQNKVAFSGDSGGESAADGQSASKPAQPENPALAGVSSLKTGKGSSLAEKKAQYSYLVGTNVGSQFRRESMELDPQILAEGYLDAMAEKIVLSDEQMQAIFNELQQEMLTRQRERLHKEGETNKAAAVKFLAENKSKDGVITTASGLQYKILKKGTSKEKPTQEQLVKLNYEGKLIDGTIFDSSYKRGQPVELRCNQVIRGWVEGLQLMSPGDTFEFYVPPELGYGPQGQGDIPAMACLIFKVEMLGITK